MPSLSSPPRARRSSPAHRRSGLSRRSRRRLVALLAIFGVAFSLIAWRLVAIQAVGNAGYKGISEDPIKPTPLLGVRGSILASDGNEMALSELRPSIFADPDEITDAATEAVKLAAVLKISAFELEAELTAKTTNVVLVQVASEALCRAVAKLHLPGIGNDELAERYYPDGRLASAIIGRIDAAGDGISGLEQNYNSILQATPGVIVQSFDPHGQPIAGTVRRYAPAVNGDDILTTINEALQYQAEQILGPAIKAAKAKDGAVLVMNTNNGDILASANLVAGKRRVRQATHALSFWQAYSPGSVAKIITISAGLAQHKITPATKLSIPNNYEVGGQPFTDDNPEAAGTKLTPMGILAQSSDVGAIRVAQRLGPDEQYRYLQDYGLTAKTDIDFPGETPGLVLAPAHYSGTTLPTVAFGNGYAVSAVQMLSAVNVVANGGVYVPPRLLAAIVNAKGHEQLVKTPKPHRVIPAWVAAEMTPMLEQVVSAGTGKLAHIRGYAVAGKTGTGVVFGPIGIVHGRYASSFAGYAPATKPAITVLVVIDNTPNYAAQAAAPVFQKVMKDALIDYGIPTAGRQPVPNIDSVPIINGHPETSLLDG